MAASHSLDLTPWNEAVSPRGENLHQYSTRTSRGRPV
jgi:hypothetical protein